MTIINATQCVPLWMQGIESWKSGVFHRIAASDNSLDDL